MSLLLALLFCMSLLCNAETPPHIVFMLGDEVGWNNVGWHNLSVTHTPNLNALAADGLLLDRHYVQRWCAPTRTALMTGRYPYNTGLMEYGKVISEERSAVPLSFQMLPKLLTQHAPTPYKAYMLGKWHLGFFTQNHTPVGRGFSTSFGFLLGESTHDTRGSQVSHTCKVSIKDLYNSTRIADDSPYATNNVYSSDMYSAEASRVIRNHQQTSPDTPMFLYFPFQNCHAPYQAPQRYQDLYAQFNGSKRCFNAMVTAMDDIVGAVVQALNETDMLAKTLIVYSSDNGGPARESNNLPLRGAKFSVFEGGLRVPAFVHAPFLGVPRGKISEKLFYVSDWYVTLATLAGVPRDVIFNASGPVPPDGMDVWSSIVNDTDSPRDVIVHEYDDVQKVYAIRSGPWKLFWGKIGESSWIADIGYGDGCSHLNPPNNGTHTILPSTSFEPIPASSAKTLLSDNGDLSCTESKPCLFNVMDDPTEHADPLKTAHANPSVVERLQQQLKHIASRRFTGHLDQAKHSQDWYCSNVVHKRKWVGPYDDSAPSPSPSPPSPPKPVPAAVAAMVSGTWAQHFYDHKKQWELFRMSVNASEGILELQPLNCTGCCFDTAHGTVTVPKTSLDSKGEALLTVVTSGGCTKHMTGTLVTDKSAPESLRVTWEEGDFVVAWSDWAKLSDS